MEELFNKPILNQMYEFRKEDFGQAIYDSNEEIKQCEDEVCELSGNFIELLKAVITDQEQLKKVLDMFKNYNQKSSKQLDLLNCAYFKLGITDGAKIKNELFSTNTDTYFNSKENDISEWLENKIRECILDTDEYKELQKKYNEISKKYPYVVKIFEDSEPFALKKEEVKALIELRKIYNNMGDLENKLCFKLGMNEILNL